MGNNIIFIDFDIKEVIEHSEVLNNYDSNYFELFESEDLDDSYDPNDDIPF